MHPFVLRQIVFEDTRLRAACTEATRCPTGGGVEERLQLELSDLLAQEAAMQSEVNSAESRVERYVVCNQKWISILVEHITVFFVVLPCCVRCSEHSESPFRCRQSKYPTVSVILCTRV